MGSHSTIHAVRIAIGADHAGFRLKEHLKETLQRLGHSVDDIGTDSEEPVDYPHICFEVASRVAERRAERGIVLGGSGQGEQIAANKVAGIRAALCHDSETARGARIWNHANILALSLRATSEALAKEILEAWFATPYSDDEWNRQQIERIHQLEERQT